MIEVRATDNPAEVLRAAGGFLLSRPVEHNVILTILHSRVAHPEPGHYWWIIERGEVAGVALQSPTWFSATATPMRPELVGALVDAIPPPLPGMIGEAATAAWFAGGWTQRHAVAGEPIEGERLYRLGGVHPVARASGRLRRAVPEERDLLIAWVSAFADETGAAATAPEAMVEQYLGEESAWLWVDGEPATMARAAPIVGGVVRIGPVFTPHELRREGYATACVERLSREIERAGHVAILYTQLSNPTSNAIYRRIGYEPVLEALRYRFDAVAPDGAPGG